MKVNQHNSTLVIFCNTRQLCLQLNKTVKEGDMFDIH